MALTSNAEMMCSHVYSHIETGIKGVLCKPFQKCHATKIVIEVGVSTHMYDG